MSSAVELHACQGLGRTAAWWRRYAGPKVNKRALHQPQLVEQTLGRWTVVCREQMLPRHPDMGIETVTRSEGVEDQIILLAPCI